MAGGTAVAVLMPFLLLVTFPTIANAAFPAADGKITFAKEFVFDRNAGTHQADIVALFMTQELYAP